MNTGSLTSRPEKPYVGPSPIQTGQPFYGRESEITELVNRLFARRIVLLHSPSGAGKTSLIQAGLLPALHGGDYSIFPRLLVSRQPLPGQIPSGQAYNPYLLSVLMLLDESLPLAEQTPVNDLAGISLMTYLERRLAHFSTVTHEDGNADNSSPDHSTPDNYLLIFDQFEEILTLEPDDQTGKQAFFGELMRVLYDYHFWALFAIREDYLAGLEPYLGYFPDRLSARYRLELLGPQTARQAIQNPARDFGVTFQDEAALRLVDDLRQVSIINHRGEVEKTPSSYIEPVQLQVVCSNLWEASRPDPQQITLADIAQWGNVDDALANYYCDRMTETVQATGVSERNLRLWIDQKLISGQGIRSQVLSGPDPDFAITEAAIDRLVDAYLVRKEPRRGAVWLELSHDRLVVPVRQNNAIWFEQNLNLLQRQALVWEKSLTPDDLLLRGAALQEAQEWATSQPGELNELEQKYLNASQRAAQEELHNQEEQAARLEAQQREAARFRRLFIAAGVVALIALVALVAAGYFGWQAGEQRASAQTANALAIANAGTAVANAGTAQAERTRADAQRSAAEAASILAEANRGTAEAASTLAYRNAARAEANAATAVAARNRARSGDLSQLANAKRVNKQFVQSFLLGVEAFKAAENFLSYNALLSSLQVSPQIEQVFLQRVNEITSNVVFDPDGKYLATGSRDGTITLWDVASRQPIGEPLRGHTDSVIDVAFSPDGKLLASGSADFTAILWDIADRKPLGKPLRGHRGVITSVAFSPDGKMLATGSSDNTIALWDVATQERVSQYLDRHANDVTDVVFSPDNKILASASLNNNYPIILWDITSQAPLGKPLAGHKHGVTSLDFNQDGTILASGSSDATIILWNVASRQPIGQPLNLPNDGIISIDFSPDGSILASLSFSYYYDLGPGMTLWDVASRQPIGQPIKIGHSVNSIAISQDGKYLAAIDADADSISLIDIAKRRPIGQPLSGLTDDVASLAFNSDEMTLTSVYYGNGDSIIRWDLTAHQPVGQPIQVAFPPYTRATISPDGNTVAGYSDSTILLYDVRSRQKLRGSLKGHTSIVSSLAFSPDGTILASGSADKTIRLWDVASQMQVGQPLSGHTENVTSLAFTPDGKTLASGGDDLKIILWDVANRQSLGELFQGQRSRITKMAFNPDGTKLAAGSADGTIILWNVASRQLINQLLLGETSPITNLVFSPDGRTLAASADLDNTFLLYDLETLQPLGKPFRATRSSYYYITSLAFSRDGKTLASGGEDGTLMLWDVDPASWAERACQIAGRNFTQVEWAEYFPGEEYRLTCPQWPAGE